MDIVLIHNKQVALCFEVMQCYKTPGKRLEERDNQKGFFVTEQLELNCSTS
jgi:hypothetical protein